jgi:hypothetical protein
MTVRAAQIDRVGATARRVRGIAHFDEAAVRDTHLRHDGALGIHRVNLAVGEEQQPSRRAGLRRHECRHQDDDE